MPQDIFHITSAGSVDDGKSTILARLLLDTGSVFEDQLGGIDPSTVDATTIADLLDGLESEREQGITIDVAHRFFDSATRRYHIADSPGHEQYTRNMATAASHADALLLVVDARVGLKPQTLTHLRIATLLGISRIIVAVNKMDLVRHSRKTFDRIEAEVRNHLDPASLIALHIIPVSGLTGTNIVTHGKQMSWWAGPTLLEALDGLTKASSAAAETVCVIQDVRRIPGGGRRYFGSLLSGELTTELTLVKAGSGKEATVAQLSHSGRGVGQVAGPSEVTISLVEEIDLERGDVVTNGVEVATTHHLEALVVWLHPEPGHPGRVVQCRLGHSATRGTITRAWAVSDDQLEKAGEIKTLQENSISRVTVDLSGQVAFAPFAEIPELGRFTLIDITTGDTLAAGIILHGLRRSDNVVAHEFTLSRADFESLTGVAGKVVWFTGLSGSGKSTVANEVSTRLHAQKIPHAILDGDTLRQGLTKDLGFSEADRIENIRRTAEVATLMADSGLIVLVSLISPYREDRENAKNIIGPHRFIEVFVDTPLDVCERRDPKGLYLKARAGKIPQFTGIDSPYERPHNPEISIDGQQSVGSSSQIVLDRLLDNT